jgi:hypothetical protein
MSCFLWFSLSSREAFKAESFRNGVTAYDNSSVPVRAIFVEVAIVNDAIASKVRAVGRIKAVCK